MLVSIFQVAKQCGTDFQVVRDWIEFGVIPPPTIVGGWLRWRQSDLNDWLQAGCPESAIVSEAECEKLWDALLAELQKLDENRKE